MPNNNYCQLCNDNFNDYIEHINSNEHKQKIEKNQLAYQQLKSTFKRINKFILEKKKEKINHSKNEEDSQQEKESIGFPNGFVGTLIYEQNKEEEYSKNTKEVKDKLKRDSIEMFNKNNVPFSSNSNCFIELSQKTGKADSLSTNLNSRYISTNKNKLSRVSSSISQNGQMAKRKFNEIKDSMKQCQINNFTRFDGGLEINKKIQNLIKNENKKKNK